MLARKKTWSKKLGACAAGQFGLFPHIELHILQGQWKVVTGAVEADPSQIPIVYM